MITKLRLTRVLEENGNIRIVTIGEVYKYNTTFEVTVRETDWLVYSDNLEKDNDAVPESLNLKLITFPYYEYTIWQYIRSFFSTPHTSSIETILRKSHSCLNAVNHLYHSIETSIPLPTNIEEMCMLYEAYQSSFVEEQNSVLSKKKRLSELPSAFEFEDWIYPTTPIPLSGQTLTDEYAGRAITIDRETDSSSRTLVDTYSPVSKNWVIPESEIFEFIKTHSSSSSTASDTTQSMSPTTAHMEFAEEDVLCELGSGKDSVVRRRNRYLQHIAKQNTEMEYMDPAMLAQYREQLAAKSKLSFMEFKILSCEMENSQKMKKV